ncbi:MAG: hypothetical protein ACP5O1_06250 [Phycisphaerae bacterium]
MLYSVFMYVEVIPNRKSPPATLLRESTRRGSIVHKRTLANISHWSPTKIEALRRLLRDEPVGWVGSPECLAVASSLPHGHVAAVLGTLRKLGLDQMISSKRCRQRDIILALIAARILFPTSKPAMFSALIVTPRASISGRMPRGPSCPATYIPIFHVCCIRDPSR